MAHHTTETGARARSPEVPKCATAAQFRMARTLHPTAGPAHAPWRCLHRAATLVKVQPALNEGPRMRVIKKGGNSRKFENSIWEHVSTLKGTQDHRFYTWDSI